MNSLELEHLAILQTLDLNHSEHGPWTIGIDIFYTLDLEYDLGRKEILNSLKTFLMNRNLLVEMCYGSSLGTFRLFLPESEFSSFKNTMDLVYGDKINHPIKLGGLNQFGFRLLWFENKSAATIYRLRAIAD